MTGILRWRRARPVTARLMPIDRTMRDLAIDGRERFAIEARGVRPAAGDAPGRRSGWSERI